LQNGFSPLESWQSGSHPGESDLLARIGSRKARPKTGTGPILRDGFRAGLPPTSPYDKPNRTGRYRCD
jgi:hypothetical protein